MSTDLITIGWNERMESAFRRMQSRGVRHLPVVDDRGEIVGMLSDRDVQRSMISLIDRPQGGLLSDETIQFDDEARVRDYMSWPAKSVSREEELRVVAETMVNEKVSSMLVRDGSRVVGIVTVDDLMRVLIELLSAPEGSARWSLGRVVDGALKPLGSTLF